jgi:CRISPR-associated protein Csm1
MAGGGKTPTIDEIALGAFFKHIGRFRQRAVGSTRPMDPAARTRDHEILSPDGHGGYSPKHASWTEELFEWLEHDTRGFPPGVELAAVRDTAVHHHPRTPLHWLSAIAESLSAGMDRAARDDTDDPAESPKDRDHFRKTPLACIFDQIDIGRGSLPPAEAYRLTTLTPESMFPATVDSETLPKLYAKLWDKFTRDLRSLCEQGGSADVFQQRLLSLSERYTWSIPCSVDRPDVSLHDHSRTAAAFAACLYRHHEIGGGLGSEAAIEDLERHKFRILVGDLSGIQSSLFRLKSEGVKGVNRTLRARSFLMGEIVEAAALLCRRQFGLPPWVVLQTAGGRFQMLLPEVPGIEARIEALRGRIDAWMLERYTGDLILNLGLTPPLAGRDFHADRFPETLRSISAATEAAKQRPLSTRLVGTGTETARIGLTYPADGTCAVCGVRPAAISGGSDDIARCETCDDENAHGRNVPKAAVVALLERDGGGLLDSFDLIIEDGAPSVDDARPLAAGFCISSREVASPFPRRFLANHLPLLREGDEAHQRYAGLDDADEVEIGQAKVFAQLAADALEWDEGAGAFRGRAMLAVLKADVDDLGFVFGCGSRRQRTTVGRLAQLSRMLDGFFTGYLTHLLATDDAYRNTYTVYAGGDDLLLIAPWLTAIRLAQRLRREFGRFVNENPNLTLSAGIEFFGVNEPLNRVVRRAEAKLKRAKHHDGKDRVALVVDDNGGIPWIGGIGSLDWALAEADWLNDRIRDGGLPATFLHRMLDLDRQRQGPSGDPGWRAKWAYHLRRMIDRLPADAPGGIGERLDGLMSGRLFDGTAAGGATAQPPDPRIPLTIALYRNR